jgi:hypothetical protein
VALERSQTIAFMPTTKTNNEDDIVFLFYILKEYNVDYQIDNSYKTFMKYMYPNIYIQSLYRIILTSPWDYVL